MSFSITLLGNENEILLNAEGSNGEEQVKLSITPLAFTPWSILFRDFLRLLYWFPHSSTLAETTLSFFKEPFVFPDETGLETHFRLEPRQMEKNLAAELWVWQPLHLKEPALSIQEGAALSFLNLLALGLAKRSDSNFLVHSDDFEDEDLFQYHGELRFIEDEFRSTGLSPFWLTSEIQRLLVVSRAHDFALPIPANISAPLIQAAEEKVMSQWTKREMENLIHFLSDLEKHWNQQYKMNPQDSGQALLDLENWIFVLNLFGFLDRFLAGLLPTRMPNPTAPFLSFLLERFFITQWESNLWPARRSALEETYRQFIPFLLQE